MRILFDQGTPVPLRHLLPDHEVVTAFERGWGALANGELLRQAETEGFDALVTTDKNLRYQQNLAARRIAIAVVTTTSWPRIQRAAAAVRSALADLTPGDYVEIDIP